jgi:hypothetical protein
MQLAARDDRPELGPAILDLVTAVLATPHAEAVRRALELAAGQEPRARRALELAALVMDIADVRASESANER